MLRQPLSRIRSAYAHAASMKEKTGCCGMPGGAVVAIRDSALTLDDYCLRTPGSANVMAKQLSGVTPGSTTSPNATLALRTLRAFEFVGITEYYDESVALLRHTLGLVGEVGMTGAATNATPAWQVLADSVAVKSNQHNSTKRTGCSSASAEALNAIDARVYREGMRLFASRFCAVWPTHREICAAKPRRLAEAAAEE